MDRKHIRNSRSTDRPMRTTRERQTTLRKATSLTELVRRALEKAGIEVGSRQRLRLYNLIANNGGKFRFSFLEDVGITASHIDLVDIYGRVPLLYEGLENDEQSTIQFDADMEALLKRKATGEHIFMYFLRMRSRDHDVWYTTYAQVRNHWELDRLIDILEKSEHDLGFLGFGGMPYHMVIEGKHYDCVPLETGNLPIEWVLRVEIPDCKCGTVNWERSGFVGGEWIENAK